MTTAAAVGKAPGTGVTRPPARYYSSIRRIWIAILMILTVGVRVGQARVPGPADSHAGPNNLDDPDAFEQGSEPSECWSDQWPDEDVWPSSQADVLQLPELERYWIGDLGFEEHQLDGWRRAEGMAGIVDCPKPKKPNDKDSKPNAQLRPSVLTDIIFFPMKKFDGPVAGFVFRTTIDKGTGYYRDNAGSGATVRLKQDEAIPILLDELIKVAVCSKELMQCNAQDGSAHMPKSKRARKRNRKRKVARKTKRMGNEGRAE